jgi:hypothetical protein
VSMDEEEKCQILLCHFPNSWDSLVMAIGSTFVILNIEDVVGSLLYGEMRRKVSINCKEALRKKERIMRKGRSKSLGMSKVSFWNYGKP